MNLKDVKSINALCFVSMAALGIYLSAYQSLVDSIKVSFLIDNTTIGFIIALHFLGITILPLVTGEIGDRFGKKTVIMLGFVFFLTGLVMIIFAQIIVPLAIGILLVGAGFGIIEGMFTAMLVDTNAEPGKPIFLSQTFFCIGTVVGPFIALLFNNVLNLSWKTNYIFVFALILILFILFTRKGVNFKQNHPIGKKTLLTLQLIKKRLVILLAVSLLLYVGVEEGIAFWINDLFKQVQSASYAGLFAISIYWGGMAVGRLVCSKINKHMRKIVLAGLVGSIAIAIIAIVFSNETVRMICFFFLGFGLSSIWPAIVFETNNRFPQYSGTVSGIMLFVSGVGGMMVPLLMGVVGDSMNMQAAFILAPVIILIILCFQIVLVRKHKAYAEQKS
ncbi:MAG: MFS transporter [Eubacteriales bacterium]